MALDGESEFAGRCERCQERGIGDGPLVVVEKGRDCLLEEGKREKKWEEAGEEAEKEEVVGADAKEESGAVGAKAGAFIPLPGAAPPAIIVAVFTLTLTAAHDVLDRWATRVRPPARLGSPWLARPTAAARANAVR
jgi:hypothetical protein